MNQPGVISRFPFLPVRVIVGGAVIYEGEALIDTGFTGAIVLPPSYQPVNVPGERPRRWRMPDGNLVEAPRYNGVVFVGNFPPMPFRAGITFLGDEPIVGVQVIQHFSVILDHGRRVIVEP